MKHVLQDIINEIVDNAQKKSCEMDPYRIDPNLREDRKEKILTKNSKVLIGYCNQIFDCILNSFNWCPEHFRNIFEYIQQALIRKFPEDEAVRYRGPNGFIFLRFFCAAITSPKNFDLLQDHPPPNAARDLTLIAKTIQNLANLLEFDQREPYMIPMNEFLKSNSNRMKDYVNQLCSPPTTAYESVTSKPNLSFGREMSRVHYHIKSLLQGFKEKYGENESDLLKLETSINNINQKLVEHDNETFDQSQNNFKISIPNI